MQTFALANPVKGEETKELRASYLEVSFDPILAFIVEKLSHKDTVIIRNYIQFIQSSIDLAILIVKIIIQGRKLVDPLIQSTRKYYYTFEILYPLYQSHNIPNIQKNLLQYEKGTIF